MKEQSFRPWLLLPWVLMILTSAALAQPNTGSYHYENNNGVEGQVKIHLSGGDNYTVEFTPDGGDTQIQHMINHNGNLIPAPGVSGQGHFDLIQGQNTATPPAMQYGTTSGPHTGSLTRGFQTT